MLFVCLCYLFFLKNPSELEQFSSSWAHFWRLFGCLEAPLATILPSQEALGAPQVPQALFRAKNSVQKGAQKAQF